MKKITILDIQRMKDEGKKITMLTAYDYPLARLFDESGVEILLVGDSLGPVVAGYDNTLPVTVEELIYHTRAVVRARENALVVADMPFMSYQADTAEAVRNAGRFLKEGYMDSVKLEGGGEIVPIVEAIIGAGIPVMGHIGLTPQSISKLGGYRVQGKTAGDAVRLLEDARALEQAGCYSIVLEAVPEPVARTISERVKIPTIGIGAGRGCDGQVLVYHDLLGLFERFRPKFVKQYANIGQISLQAIREFAAEVEEGRFPTSEHTYPIDEDEYQKFLEKIG